MKQPNAEKRKILTPMIHNLIKNLDDWADDYKNVMDKVNNLRPKSRSGGKRQRIHIWIHREGNPIPQHIMVTTNKPSEMAYRRHIRIDATQGFYDTHASPAQYLDGLLGLTGELKFQKIASRDRYLTGGKDEDSIVEEAGSGEGADEPVIVNEKGSRVLPSNQDLLLEGALQTESGVAIYCFLFADTLVTTVMVNNGEKFVMKGSMKFDADSTLVPSFQGNPRAFLIRGRRGKERVFNAKSKQVASTWCSNIESVLRKKF